ncbi:MAG: hypothetical protein KF767_11285 [Bdellovibrionaceae bacterium]|nr:hypothetical protein [Pseudobdellovibrionaceae bacterium]
MVAKTNSQSGSYHPALLLIALLSVGSTTLAARYVLPAESTGKIELRNPTGETLEIYRKDFSTGTQSLTEVAHRISPRTTLSLPVSVGTQLSVIDVPDFVKSPLQFTDAQGNLRALSGGQSNHLYFPARAARNSGELVITNLSSQSHDGRILSRKPGEEGLELRRFRVSGREVLKLDLSGFSGTAFAIESDFSLQAHIKSAPLEFAELRPNARALPAPRGRYFVLSNSSRTASYLVDLADPAMIAAAREQIRDPETYLPRILVAEVGVNLLNDNRNWDDKTQHPWSWRIAQPIRFASLASQACDGHPQQLEDQLEAWLSGAYTGGRPIICFWGYQVVEELP